MNHWAIQYIGLGYRHGAVGPTEFDCWGFVRWCLDKHYGIAVPAIEPSSYQVLSYAREFRKHPEVSRWSRVDKPMDGDVALLSCSRTPHHCGIYADADGGVVVHALENVGVVAQTLPSLSSKGWTKQEFWRLERA